MDMNYQLIRTIFTAHTKLGLAIPKKLTAAADDVERVTTVMGTLGVSDNIKNKAIAAAILDHRDPTTDPEVMRITIAQQIAVNNPEGIISYAKVPLFDAFNECAPTLLDQWATAFDKAAKTIADEHPHLGDVNLTTDADAILGRGGDIAAHYIAARDADDAIETIRTAVSSLGQVSRLYSIDAQRYWNMVITPAPLDQWEQHGLHERRTAWQLYGLGVPLEFADGAEYKRRHAAHQAVREQRVLASRAAANGKYPEGSRATDIFG